MAPGQQGTGARRRGARCCKPPIEGSAGSASIEGGHFRRSGQVFYLVGRVRDLSGMESRDTKFLPGRIDLTLARHLEAMQQIQALTKKIGRAP